MCKQITKIVFVSWHKVPDDKAKRDQDRAKDRHREVEGVTMIQAVKAYTLQTCMQTSLADLSAESPDKSRLVSVSLYTNRLVCIQAWTDKSRH